MNKITERKTYSNETSRPDKIHLNKGEKKNSKTYKNIIGMIAIIAVLILGIILGRINVQDSSNKNNTQNETNKNSTLLTTLIGNWVTDDGESKISLTDNTFNKNSYKVLKTDSNSIVIEVKENSIPTKYKINLIDDSSITLYSYNTDTSSYTGGSQYSKVNDSKQTTNTDSTLPTLSFNPRDKVKSPEVPQNSGGQVFDNQQDLYNKAVDCFEKKDYDKSLEYLYGIAKIQDPYPYAQEMITYIDSYKRQHGQSVRLDYDRFVRNHSYFVNNSAWINGKILTIQENENKTIFSLSYSTALYEHTAVITLNGLYPNLKSGSQIKVEGVVKGNYLENEYDIKKVFGTGFKLTIVDDDMLNKEYIAWIDKAKIK